MFSGTVRDLSNTARYSHLMQLPNWFSLLHMVKADLLEPECWASAFEGCDAVFHTASPFFWGSKNPEAELVKPAVDGTLNVLRAAACHPQITRVVLTSSVAAILGDRPPEFVYDESTWNDSDTFEKFLPLRHSGG